ncbi:DUF4158 domain-containing protein [Streptosporangium canum]|uniref:DUF4158 domain-containing protein n=1 Tax=Streptosporangium canum TaxID=324952 RepID=UPI0034419384
MPVGFLSDDQVRAYMAFEELPSLSDLEKFFFLDAFDRDVIAKSRQDSHRLGVTVQIGTVRYKGLFLEDPLAVPWPVVDYLAEQLGMALRSRTCPSRQVAGERLRFGSGVVGVSGDAGERPSSGGVVRDP